MDISILGRSLIFSETQKQEWKVWNNGDILDQASYYLTKQLCILSMVLILALAPRYRIFNVHIEYFFDDVDILPRMLIIKTIWFNSVSYTHLRAHETRHDLV